MLRPFDPGSREEEARAEIAATRIAHGAARVLVACALALIAVGPLFEAFAVTRGQSQMLSVLPAARDGAGVVERIRQVIAEIENRFDERSALVRLVRPHLQQLLVDVLGEGNSKVVVGRGRRLLLASDVDHLILRRGAALDTADAERAIVGFRNELAVRGIALLVVPVPVKPAIEPETVGFSGRAPSPPLRAAGEERLLARLRSENVELLDLADRFARDAALGEIYLASDTHWRPEAVETAAIECAIRLRELATLPSALPGRPSATADEPTTRIVDRAGDLAALLALPPGSFPREKVVVTISPPAPRNQRAPVVVLGDSFAGIYSAAELGDEAGAGFAERLEAALGVPVDAIVQNAGGATATRERLARELEADPTRLEGVRAVVWLFVARDWRWGTWREVPLQPGAPLEGDSG